MPGLIIETEKKLQEDDWIMEDDDDVNDSDEDDDSEDSDDDDNDDDDAEDPTGEQLAEIRMKLANIQRDLTDIRIMMKDNFKQILLTLEALPNKVSEIIAQHIAGLSVSHEPGLTPTSTTVDAVASKPDSAYSSPAHAPDADATTGCTLDRTSAFLAPAAVASIPPIEVGDTHMPDAAA